MDCNIIENNRELHMTITESIYYFLIIIKKKEFY